MRRRLRSPAAQLSAAGLVMVGGAWLIAVWVVGLVLMVEAAVFVLVFFDDGKPPRSPSSHDGIMDRYRRAR